MNRTNRKTDFLLLTALAAMSAIIWRVEIALHGQAEPWTQYFHWALPVSIILLSAWVMQTCRTLPPAGRLWAGFFVTLVSLLSAILAATSLGNLVRGGVLFFDKPWISRINDLLSVGAVLIIPVYYASAAWVVGLTVGWRTLAASLAMFWAALPVGMAMAGLSADGFDPSLRNALRSGWSIPLIVISLGLLFLSPPAKKE